MLHVALFLWIQIFVFVCSYISNRKILIITFLSYGAIASQSQTIGFVVLLTLLWQKSFVRGLLPIFGPRYVFRIAWKCLAPF